MSAADAVEYVYLNAGIQDSLEDPDASEYTYLNVGAAVTLDPDAVEYVYLNTTEPLSTMYFSDGLQWFWLPDSNLVKDWIAAAKEEAIFYTNTKTSKVTLTSPDGTKWTLGVNDDGSLTTTEE